MNFMEYGKLKCLKNDLIEGFACETYRRSCAPVRINKTAHNHRRVSSQMCSKFWIVFSSNVDWSLQSFHFIPFLWNRSSWMFLFIGIFFCFWNYTSIASHSCIAISHVSSLFLRSFAMATASFFPCHSIVINWTNSHFFIFILLYTRWTFPKTELFLLRLLKIKTHISILLKILLCAVEISF